MRLSWSYPNRCLCPLLEEPEAADRAEQPEPAVVRVAPCRIGA